jgi:hypothetical protein
MLTDTLYNISIKRFDIGSQNENILFDHMNVLGSKDLSDLVISYLSKNMNLTIFSKWDMLEEEEEYTIFEISIDYNNTKYIFQHSSYDNGLSLAIIGLSNFKLLDIQMKDGYTLESLMEIIKNELIDKDDLNSAIDVLFIFDRRIKELIN